APPQPCRALCPRRAKDDRLLLQRARLCGQRRRRGRPHYLPLTQPERPSPGRAGARPDDRHRGANGPAGVVQCRHPRSGAEGVPQGARRRLRGISPICHGNAWSVYFQDPEGNRIEMFCDTPWYLPQPLGFKIDLDKPEDELFRETEAYCRDREGFKPMEAWRAEISEKIAAKLERDAE